MKEDKDMAIDQAKKEAIYQEKYRKAMRKQMIREITHKVCDRNDEALRKLSKS